MVWYSKGFPGDSVGKECPYNAGDVFSLWGKDPMEEGMATHSSILVWEIPWKRSLVGYSPYSYKESDITEATEQHSILN